MICLVISLSLGWQKDHLTPTSKLNMVIAKCKIKISNAGGGVELCFGGAASARVLIFFFSTPKFFFFGGGGGGVFVCGGWILGGPKDPGGN